MALSQDLGNGAYAAPFDCGYYLGFFEEPISAKLVGRNHSFRYIEAEGSYRKRRDLDGLYVMTEFGFAVIGVGMLHLLCA
jgi:hypothetical protein